MAQVFTRVFCKPALFATLLTVLTSCAADSSDSVIAHEPSAAPLTKIRIGTYNVENFWDDIQDNTSDPYDAFGTETSNWYADKLYLQKAENAAKAISLADSPDVLALQEIESGKNTSRTLTLLEPHLRKLGYKYFVLGKQQKKNPTSITTAVISKYPILSNQSLLLNGDSSARDPQIVEIQIQKAKLRLYVNHWKSQNQSTEEEDTELKRIEAAKIVAADIARARIAEPNTDIIALGDFNSEYNESQIAQRETGMNTFLLSTGDERLMVQKEHVPQLYNLWFDRPVKKRCSYSYQEKLQCIDNILVTDTLFDNSGLRLVSNSLEVVGRDGGEAQKVLLNADGAPLRWQVRLEFRGQKPYYRHVGVGFSDHLPLVASFYVQDVNNQPVKVKYSDLSTTPEGPSVDIPEKVPSCAQTAPEDFLQADSADPTNLLKCFLVSGDDTYKLSMTADHLVYTRINKQPIGVTLIHSTDVEGHKFLKDAVGKSATNITGRLGWNRGLRTLFIDNTKSMTVVPEN